MTIYVDRLEVHYQPPKPGATRHFGNGKSSCHMATDGDLEELHQFAERLGLRRSWLHNSSSAPHYDLTPNKRAQAVALGAVELASSRELIEKCGPRRARPAQEATGASDAA